ncbi:MAG: tetratricopeptide repeat protein, partial [Bacteroidota bacterium]|nr:tetratricopeptide repeat protein [Bacteroidota bacterium]
MKKQQIIIAGSGIIILVVFYFFGNTVPPLKRPANSPASAGKSQSIDIKVILDAVKSKLSQGRLEYVNRLENAVVRGDIKNQQIEADRQLAIFYKDSIENGFLPAAYYTAEAAKLENSEKSLTFAAQLFLNNLRGQDNPALKIWMANQSRELFERAEIINPGNDSTKIGLGAIYIFGGTGEPAEVMKGIQKILEVTRRDSLNMYAQLMLGLGGIESGQYDKAIQRLLKVVRFDPGNLEAVLNLGEAYEKTGNTAAAKSWYTEAKKLTNNQELIDAIDERLGGLK